MFTKVSIKNFKSIRGLEFAPKRVNVFIGEPNSGKSNLLEALALFSEGSRDLQGMIRFKSVGDFFYDRDLSETVSIRVDGWGWTLRLISSRYEGEFDDGPLRVTTVGKQDGASAQLSLGGHRYKLNLEHDGRGSGTWPPNLPARYYAYKPMPGFGSDSLGFLQPPHGSNLVALLTTNKRLRSLVSDLFKAKGFRLSIDSERNELFLTKDVNDQLYQFSYQTVSETLRRIVFYMAALETNQNAVLLLDEPEANTFPFYTTYLAERIALDETNQFFLTTHNPYVLGSIVAKTPVKDLAVFVAEMADFQTVLKSVPPAGLSRILDYGSSAFLNLERLTEA